MVAQGIPEIGAYIGFLFVSTVALIIVLRLLVTPRDPRPSPEKKKPSESAQMAPGPGRTRRILQDYPYLFVFLVDGFLGMFLFPLGHPLRALRAPSSPPG